MSNFVDNDNATALMGAVETSIANTRTFKGTLDQWDALTAEEKAKYSFIATPDGVIEDVSNVVADGDMRPVTSNAVYEALQNVTPTSSDLFGVEWDGGSSPAMTRTDGAAKFSDPSPAVNNGDGSSPFDDIYPWKGMEIVEDPTAGTLVSIPKYWYRWTKTGSKMKLQISNIPRSGFLCSPAHAKRGDNAGERDVVYVGRYHCATSTYKSASGIAPQASKTRSAFRSSIHNLGNEYWQYDFAMYWTIMMLYLVEYANWNSQAVIGYGCSDSGSVQNSGTTDGMIYHTGTSAANKTTYGHTQYRHIEDLWGNVFDWCDGVYFAGADVMIINNPSNFSDTTGGTKVGTRATVSNEIKSFFVPSSSGLEWALYPDETVSNSNYDTYVCDHCNYSASGVVLRVGGVYYQDQSRGAFCLSGNDAASYSFQYIGARLQKLPN